MSPLRPVNPAFPAALALLLAGCTVGPDYQRPSPVALPAAYEAGTAPADAAVQREWWKLYKDAQLDALVAAALERNADARIAAARIEETDANLREAGASFLPPVDLAASPSRQQVSTRLATVAQQPLVRSNARLALTTSFELDFWGRLRRGVEAARANALASRYGRDVVALSLSGLVAQTYFSVRSLDAQLLVTRESLRSREESYRTVRDRASGGIASDLELNQAEVARRDASSQLTELQRQRELVVHQLGALTGKPDLALGGGDIRSLPLPPVPPTGIPASLLERRPDIRQAEQALVAANAQIGVARAAMLPTISLTGSYGSESRDLADLLSRGTNIWSLAFGLALPVFDWGRLQARSDAASARARQSLGGYQKAIESGFRDVADALTNLRQYALAEEDVEARVRAARSSLELAQLRYKSGYSGYLEVLDAQRTANEAELALLRNRQSRLSASVDLMKALGGGWDAQAAEQGLSATGLSAIGAR